jgi:hypothetical protein
MGSHARSVYSYTRVETSVLQPWRVCFGNAGGSGRSGSPLLVADGRVYLKF